MPWAWARVSSRSSCWASLVFAGTRSLPGRWSGSWRSSQYWAKLAGPLRADSCLEGARRVIDAAVQDAAVATAGVAAWGWLFLQDDDALIRVAVLQLASEGQSDDSGADD